MDTKRYVAFLRGINISGKNKVPMAELKQGFERLDYKEVKTYLNSGNVIFSSDEADTIKITSRNFENVDNGIRFLQSDGGMQTCPIPFVMKKKL